MAADEFQCFRQEFMHGPACRLGRMFGDRIQHFLMQRQENRIGLTRYPVADMKPDRDEIAHLQKQRILSGRQNAAMKVEILLGPRGSGSTRRRHAFISFADRVDLLLAGTLRCQKSRFRLDHQADFEKLMIKLRRRHRAVSPGENLDIEQIPMHWRKNANSGSRPRFDQPLCRERFDRLADHRSARAELAPEIGFIWKSFVRFQIASYDANAEVLDHMGKQIALACPPDSHLSWKNSHSTNARSLRLDRETNNYIIII